MSAVTDFFSQLASGVMGDKEVKTQAVVLAVRTLIGSDPIVDRSNPNTNVIKFTKAQRLKIEKFFTKDKKTGPGGLPAQPSNLKIEHQSLWMPYAIKKAMPYILGVGLLGYAIGKKF
jgi:hypothetical protein